MTWGQIRLQLQSSAPGTSLDLIDEFLVARYEQILDTRDWKGLRSHATIETEAAYQSSADTVTTTVGSATITGAGTAWVSQDQLQVGNGFVIEGDNESYTVMVIASDTSLTLDRPYEGQTGDTPGTVTTAQAYLAFVNIYPLPADCKIIEEVKNPVSGYPMQRMTKAELDESAGPRNYVDDPQIYCLYDNTTENSPPVLGQIEFYPPPEYQRGYELRYQRSANQFTGSNTSVSPLPFVEVSAFLHGVRSDIYALLAAQGSAAAGSMVKFYEGKFQEALNRMTKQDMLREPYPKVEMAARFVRHRLTRALRSFNRNWGIGQGGPN